MMPASLLAQGLTQKGDLRWIVLASRLDLNEAIGLARYYEGKVALANNGWYAIVKDPIAVRDQNATRQALLKQRDYPKDLLFSRGDGYQRIIWQTDKPILAEGTFNKKKTATLQSGALRITAGPQRKNNKTSLFVQIAQQGKTVLRFDLEDEDDIDLDYDAYVKIVYLDKSVSVPQVIIATYTGGAHCCTQTLIAGLQPDGSWSKIEAPMLDGSGFMFSDLDGDGESELISVDQSFLYTYASYAESYAPHQIWKYKSAELKDLSGEARFQDYFKQQIAMFEHSEAKDAELGHNNGYLAAWVGAKARAGQGEQAWARMLKDYDKESDWILSDCKVPLDKGLCPKGQEINLDFPTALAKHLLEAGYQLALNKPAPASSTIEPVAKPNPEMDRSPVNAGTGLFISADGLVLTNARLAATCPILVMTRPGEPSFVGSVIAQDIDLDLALVRTAIKPAIWGELRLNVRQSEGIYVFGYPLSGVVDSRSNFSEASVTSLNGGTNEGKFFQISASLRAGQGGGPVLDQSGNLVGLLSAGLQPVSAREISRFLEAQGVTPAKGSANAPKSLDDLMRKSKELSVIAGCPR
jgi:S1-C subfamily serine protease